jgi:hypothetical protein
VTEVLTVLYELAPQVLSSRTPSACGRRHRRQRVSAAGENWATCAGEIWGLAEQPGLRA